MSVSQSNKETLVTDVVVSGKPARTHELRNNIIAAVLGVGLLVGSFLGGYKVSEQYAPPTSSQRVAIVKDFLGWSIPFLDAYCEAGHFIGDYDTSPCIVGMLWDFATSTPEPEKKVEKK